MSEISEHEYAKLVAECDALRYGNQVGDLHFERRTFERDVVVDRWIEYRDGLPHDIRVAAVQAYRMGFKARCSR